MCGVWCPQIVTVCVWCNVQRLDGVRSMVSTDCDGVWSLVSTDCDGLWSVVFTDCDSVWIVVSIQGYDGVWSVVSRDHSACRVLFSKGDVSLAVCAAFFCSRYALYKLRLVGTVKIQTGCPLCES